MGDFKPVQGYTDGENFFSNLGDLVKFSNATNSNRRGGGCFLGFLCGLGAVALALVVLAAYGASIAG